MKFVKFVVMMAIVAVEEVVVKQEMSKVIQMVEEALMMEV